MAVLGLTVRHLRGRTARAYRSRATPHHATTTTMTTNTTTMTTTTHNDSQQYHRWVGCYSVWERQQLQQHSGCHYMLAALGSEQLGYCDGLYVGY